MGWRVECGFLGLESSYIAKETEYIGRLGG